MESSARFGLAFRPRNKATASEGTDSRGQSEARSQHKKREQARPGVKSHQRLDGVRATAASAWRILSAMHRFLICAISVGTLFAQLPAPNQSGVSMGHVHLLVADPELQKKIWIEALGAELTHVGSLDLLRIPGIYVVVGKAGTAPSEGSEGSSVSHLGFAVRDLTAVKAKLDALHIESTPVNGNSKQILAAFPEKVTVELTEDPALPTAVAMHDFLLATTNPEELRAWYARTFGARPGMSGNFLVDFIPGGELDIDKTQAAPAPTKGRSVDHIGFEVRNLEAFCKQLVADGVQLESPFRDMSNIGLKWAFVVDPDGTRIELTEGFAGK